MTNIEPRWVSIANAATLTGRSQRTIRRWVKDEKIPADRTGPLIRVDIGGLAAVTGGTPDNVASEVVKLTAEVERLRSLLEAVTSERDYLRQLTANVIVNQAAQLETRTRRRFRWPWQRGE